MMRFFFVAAALATGAAWPAPALAQEPSQVCVAFADTASSPPVTAVTDPAALLQAWPEPGGEPASLVTVRYDASGSPEAVRAYRGKEPVGGGEAKRINRELRPLFLRQPPRERASAFWLVREGESELRFARFRRECKPALRNPEETAERLQTAYGRALERLGSTALVDTRALVRIHVDEEGEPVEVRIEERTGSLELDQEAIWVARRMRFLPARLDGYPVEVLISMPVQFLRQ